MSDQKDFSTSVQPVVVELWNEKLTSCWTQTTEIQTVKTMGIEISKVSGRVCKSYFSSHKDDDAVEEVRVTADKVVAEKVDPRLPLTQRQVYKIKTSWKGVRREITSAGLEMFIR